jgi:glutamate-1-semialdehyde 2,1-aminomutase
MLDRINASGGMAMFSFDKSAALFEAARASIAGGVNSNVRYGESPPLFFVRGDGPRLHDVDGNVLIDYVLGNGPAILGHAAPAVIGPVAASLSTGQSIAGQHRGEIDLAARLKRIVASAELVRFSVTGSEAVHAAIRLARGYTGRSRFVKFEGQYHGWLDNVFISTRPGLNEAGPRESPAAVLMSRGQAERAKDEVIVLPWNDAAALARAFEVHGADIAAVLTEPVMCNCGVIPPRQGYLEAMRKMCSDAGAVLIFDEVITGFRVGLGGAQARFGVTPDLSVFAKAVANGFPLSVLAGKRAIMELIEPKGQVVHSGTYNGNITSVTAAVATLDALAADPQAYARMEARGTRLMEGLRQCARRHGEDVLVQGFGSVFCTLFTDAKEVVDFRSATAADAARMNAFAAALARNGVRTTPRGVWFLSMAHGEAEIDATLAAVDKAMAELAR